MSDKRRRRGVRSHAGSAYAVETLERRVLLSGYALTTLAQFGYNTTGARPESTLAMDRSGNLYGTTADAGPSGNGTVFEIAHGSEAITTLASFDSTNEINPNGVVLDGSGNLYGTTFWGGAANDGSVFEIAAGSGTITTLASFDSTTGIFPSAVVMDGSGNLYGTTYNDGANGYGTVFELSKGSAPNWTFSTLASLDGANGAHPQGGLALDASGNLYGVTSGGGANDSGTVFELSKGSGSSWTLGSLASFDPGQGILPGSGPHPLVLDADGNLYGIASNADANGRPINDTVFELTKRSVSSWTLNTIASFPSANPALVLDAGGNLYGTTGDGVFELSKGGGSNWTLNTIASAGPISTIDASGNLYGATGEGGAHDAGTVFELSKGGGSTWALTTLASFDAPNVGPAGLALDPGGNLYGTYSDLMRSSGGLFELSKGSGLGQTPKTLAAFNAYPYGPLVLDDAGNLYGTTVNVQQGPCCGYNISGGAVFELAKGSEPPSTLFSFDGAGTIGPDLVLDPSGNLYGTASAADALYAGNPVNTVFELSKGNGIWTLNTLASFGPNDRVGGLVLNASGNLYGVKRGGVDENGNNGPSTIFELSKGTDLSWTLRTLASFDTSGGYPLPSLAIDANGNLYGTTSSADIYGNPVSSTVFELSKGNGSSWTLSTLVTSVGAMGLVLDASGNLYGIGDSGESGDYGGYYGSTVFELSKGSGSSWTLSTLATFDPNALHPAALVVDASGNLYGTEWQGGVLGRGAVFELVAQPSQIAGTVWADTNHNGTLDPGETGLAGVTVFLDLNGDGKLDPGDPTATTDSSGNYTFTGLHPGTYTVRQVLPDGYAATAPRSYSETVRLGAGENAAGPNFGDVRISSVTLGFDYLLLIARNYGRAGTFADGDLNGDGRVNFDDLVLLARHYGRPLSALR